MATTFCPKVQANDYTLAIAPVGNWRVVYAVDVKAEAIATDVRYLLTE